MCTYMKRLVEIKKKFSKTFFSVSLNIAIFTKIIYFSKQMIIFTSKYFSNY